MKLNEEVVKYISESKDEPKWMLEFRLKALKVFNKLSLPKWAIPKLEEINFDEIEYYKPQSVRANSWEDVPEEIRELYEKIGVPEAERDFLIGGSIAQFQSEPVYERLNEQVKSMGVIFTGMENALKEHPDLVKKYFSKLVPPTDNKFAALHYAVWSGGSFLYVPKGVKVPVPLHIFFYMKERSEGQFEHTLIVAEDNSSVHYVEGCAAPLYDKNSLHASAVEVFVGNYAQVKYTTMQNWSKNVWNLATKRSSVGKFGKMEWITGSIGSKVVMAYPSIYLNGEGAIGNMLAVGIAGEGIIKEEGAKIYHRSPNTKSNVLAKSISLPGGYNVYRGIVQIDKGAKNSFSSVKCDSLLLGDNAKGDSYPYVDIREKEGVNYNHEAKAGKISEEIVNYLQTRGFNEDEITQMYVMGYVQPFFKDIPLEYVLELTKLLKIEVDKYVRDRQS